MWSLRRLMAASIVAGSLAASACSEQSAAPAPPPPPPPAVTVAPVVRTTIKPTSDFVGQIEAVDQVDLRARVEGFLEQRAFEEGEIVRQGRRLFLIERGPYQAAVDVAKARVAEAKARAARASRDLERAQMLHARGDASEKARDDALAEQLQAAAAVQAAEAGQRQAELDLGYTDIVAPFEGRIGRAAYSVGNLVGPSSRVLATLMRLDPIYATFSISESAYLNYRQHIEAAARAGGPGAEMVPRLRLPNGAEYPHPGRIEFLDNRVDPSTGTVTVRASFPNPDKLLLPGLYVTVQVARAEAEPALLIPQAAVQEDQAGRFVLVVTPESTAEVRRVDLGERVGIYWQVRSGLNEGDRVIYEGIQKVRPGGKVTPSETPPAAPTS